MIKLQICFLFFIVKKVCYYSTHQISSQEAVLNVLKEATHVQPVLLKEQVEAVRHKHRVARYSGIHF